MSQDEFLPLVSIITPVFNGDEYLEKLILSVKGQDYPCIEHLIIDDGSNDNGATVAILKRHPHLVWWSRENRGQYATMNEGLDAAQGEIIMFISADDVMAKNAVNTALQYLLDHPEKDGVYGDYEYINGAGKPLHPLRPFRKVHTSLYPYSLHISHSSLYLRKNKIMDNGLYFDDKLKYVGDYEWIVRILLQPLNVGCIPLNLSFVRQHSDQASKVNFFSMREETFKVQRRLGVSAFAASLFRKILFSARLLTALRDSGFKEAYSILDNRLR